MDTWLHLTPREVELIMRPVNGTGDNADILRTVQGKVKVARNEVELTGSEVLRVRAAARNWRAGCERQLKALDEALNRHV